MSINQIKQKARTHLIGRYGILIAASLFFEALIIVVGNLFISTSSFTALAASVVITLLAGIVEAGLYRLYMLAIYGEKITLGDLFYCFGHAPDRYILLALANLVIKTVLTLPCSVLLPVWAAYYLMPFPFYASGLLSGIPLFLRVILAIIWCTLALIIYLHFILLFPIAICDESMTVPQIIRESTSLMKGNCLRFAAMQLSFIGYLLLGLCSIGIGYLWIVPYIRMCTVCFFLDLITVDKPDEPFEETYISAEQEGL